MNTLALIFSTMQSLFDKKPIFKHLEDLASTMFSMIGKKNMLNLSRWTLRSYRTLIRFFHTENLPWTLSNLFLIKEFLEPDDTLFLAADITVVSKSGKKTSKLGNFFSSIESRVVSGVAFMALTAVSVNTRKSWPIAIMQISKEEMNQVQELQNQKENHKKSKKKKILLKGEMRQVSIILTKYLKLIREIIPNISPYLVYDGAFGNNAATEMLKTFDLTIISKLRVNSALFLRYTGEYQGIGRPCIWGDKIDFKNIPKKFLIPEEQKTEDEKDFEIYQFQAKGRTFSAPLNVVIIKNAKKSFRRILFSSDLNLKWDKILSYYRLRFQIEFNFRDAKQHWGLKDFMAIKEAPILNSVNLSMYMVNVSQIMLLKSDISNQSIFDLKSHFHGIKYVNIAIESLEKSRETLLKISPQNPLKALSILKEFLTEEFSIIGRIHIKKPQNEELKRAG